MYKISGSCCFSFTRGCQVVEDYGPGFCTTLKLLLRRTRVQQNAGQLKKEVFFSGFRFRIMKNAMNERSYSSTIVLKLN